jgi:Domain of unknown function (DUF4158)
MQGDVPRFGVCLVPSSSIERTAYPRFKRLLSARELHVFFTPQPDEVAWARGVAGSDKHVLALVVWLKCFGRLGYFPALDAVPAGVVDHVRRDLGLAEQTAARHAAARTAERHRDLVRRRAGVVLDPGGARKVAAEAIREAAFVRNHPPDLINIALERLVEALLTPAGAGGKTGFDRLKRSAPRPSWTNFRKQLDYLRWADGLGDAAGWVEGVAASKLADFAGEAGVADVAVMRACPHGAGGAQGSAPGGDRAANRQLPVGAGAHSRFAPGRVHWRRRRAAVGRPESRKATRRPESPTTRMTPA